jgi:hypothetical protein
MPNQGNYCLRHAYYAARSHWRHSAILKSWSSHSANYLVDMTVTTALSPDGKTLLILTSGFNQNLDANGNVDPNTSNEYVFVFDVSGQTPR